MKLWQWLMIDLKRLFRGRGMVLATLLTASTGLTVFSSVAVPMLTLGNKLKVPYAICNEDESKPVRQFSSLMINSESLKELGTPFPVKDVEIGYKLLKEGKVGVLVHIPKNFYQIMSTGQNPVMYLIAYPAHSFEQTMVCITLDGSLRAVGQSQNILQSVEEAMIEAGADKNLLAATLDAELTEGIKNFLERRACLGECGAVSPVGELFPVEYYLCALFSLFAALAILPSLHLTSHDLSGSVCRRGLLSDKKTFVRYYCARFLSGAALVLLTLILLIPTAGVIQGMEVFRRNTTPLMWPTLAGALLLISLCFSAFSLVLSGVFRQPRLTLWVGFVSILLMAVSSGALVAEGKLPGFLAEIGRWTPLKTSMNLTSNLLFNLDLTRYTHDMIRLSLMTLIFVASGFCIVSHRGGAK